MRLSIIIVSYNTRQILDHCLASIEGSLRGSSLDNRYEVIVIDNASSDGSPEMVMQKHPEVRLAVNSENRYFAGANNQGAELASGEYLLLLNSDTLVEKGNIEKLIEFLERNPLPVVMVGPLVLNADRSRQSCGFALPSVWERLAMVAGLTKILPHCLLPFGSPARRDYCRQTGWISGCCMMIRHSVYRELGGLNAEVGFYGEEPELGYRLAQHGFQTWVLPEAVIIHLGGASTCGEIKRDLAREAVRIRNYAALQRLTVGYPRAIRMSRVVVWGARMKWWFSIGKRRRYLSAMIDYEKNVIAHLKECLEHEKSSD